MGEFIKVSLLSSDMEAGSQFILRNAVAIDHTFSVGLADQVVPSGQAAMDDNAEEEEGEDLVDFGRKEEIVAWREKCSRLEEKLEVRSKPLNLHVPLSWRDQWMIGATRSKFDALRSFCSWSSSSSARKKINGS